MSASPSVPPAGDRPTRYRFVVLAMFCALAALSYLDRICMREVQDDVTRDLGLAAVTPAEASAARAKGGEDAVRVLQNDRARERMSWVFTAFTIGYLLFEVPGGWLGDRWGVRWVLTQIVLFWSVFTALTGSIDSLVRFFVADPGWPLLMAAMIAVRFAFGSMAAGAFPNIGGGMGHWFPASERATATGVIWLFTRVGGALTPFVFAGFVQLTGGWRQAMWMLGGVGLAWAAWFYLCYRDRPEDHPAVNAAEAAHVRAGASGGHGHDHPPWGRLFGSANLWAFYAAVIALNFCWYFYLTYLPRYLRERFHVSDWDVKVMTALPFVFGGFGCVIGGWLSDRLVRRFGARWGRAGVALAAYLGAASAFLAVPFAQTAWAAALLLSCAHGLQDFSVPIVWALAVEIGGRHAGTVGGAQNAMGGVGALLGPVVVAYAVSLIPAADPAARWNGIFYLFAGMYALGALAWLRIDATEPLEGAKG